MISSSKGMTGSEVERVLSLIEDGSYKSALDGCEVMAAICAKCGRIFEEEVCSFREKIIARRDLFCLRCDPRAEEFAVLILVIHVGCPGE